MKKPGKIKAAVMHWLGIDSLLSTDTGYPLAQEAGETITPGTAMTIPAVWACVSIISETIATLPLKLYLRSGDGRIEATNHPLYRALGAQPNADMTAVEFWQAFVASMLLWGNGYAEKIVSGNRIIGLILIPPGNITRTCDARGRIEYRIYIKGNTRILSESQVMHVPALSVDGRIGITPICAGAKMFGSSQAANSASTSTFEKGLHPTVAFKYPQVMKKEQRDDARDTIKSLSGAMMAGNPVILEAGMDVVTIGINPHDAQLLESRNFSVEEVARWFRVPPFMIGHTTNSTSWGTGIEQQMIGFVRFTLRPWLTRIEQSISKSLLTPVEKASYFAEFNIEGLLRGDSAARREFYASALQNGWMNRDQVAAKENLPKIPGGEIYTVQSNLIPLDKLGTISEDEAVRNAPGG
jgi:HK97 family phage portal protein